MIKPKKLRLSIFTIQILNCKCKERLDLKESWGKVGFEELKGGFIKLRFHIEGRKLYTLQMKLDFLKHKIKLHWRIKLSLCKKLGKYLKTDEKLLPGTEGVLCTCRQNAALLFLQLYILTTWVEVNDRGSDNYYLLLYSKKPIETEKQWQLLKVVALGLVVLLAFQELSVCQVGDCTHEDQSSDDVY